MLTAEALLAGPRGRDLCLGILSDCPGGQELWDLARAGDLASLTAVAADVDLRAFAVSADPLSLFEDVHGLVNGGMYWQESWDADTERVLARADVRAALLPAAAALLSAPGLRWWGAPADLDCQHFVQFLGDDGVPDSYDLDLSGAADGLARWRKDTLGRSSHWWSSPVGDLPHTFPLVSGVGLVGLPLIEDGFGWGRARSWPLRPAAGVRVYEVTGPDALASLVNRYPIGVTRSRSGPWGMSTGVKSRWLIPDYAAVAADWDAVHVSLLGYLATAGAAVAVEGGHTMLAGWEPHATWWLTDSISLAGPAAAWEAANGENDPFGWHPVG